MTSVPNSDPGLSPLHQGFCEYLLSKYSVPQHESPEAIARDFSFYFCLQTPLTVDDVKQLSHNIGTGYPECKSIDTACRGFHVGAYGTYRIFYKKNDSPGGIRYTILHEVWEIIQHQLDELCLAESPRNGNAERRADLFAAAVLMPWYEFREHCIRMKFDPLLLYDKYDLAPIAVLLRMRDVFADEMPFVCLVYENTPRKQHYERGLSAAPIDFRGLDFEDPLNYDLTKRIVSYTRKLWMN